MTHILRSLEWSLLKHIYTISIVYCLNVLITWLYLIVLILKCKTRACLQQFSDWLKGADEINQLSERYAIDYFWRHFSEFSNKICSTTLCCLHSVIKTCRSTCRQHSNLKTWRVKKGRTNQHILIVRNYYRSDVWG